MNLHRLLIWVTVSAVFAFAAVATQPAMSQQAAPHQRPLVVLTSLTAHQGDLVAEQLASTISGSIALTLRLSGSLRVQDAGFLLPTVSLPRATQYYRQVRASFAVFGSVSPGSAGSYTVDLEIWNANHPHSVPTLIRRKITNPLESFRLADTLALQVASTAVGRRLAEGTLDIRDLGHLKKYAVYANGHLLGRSRSTFRILTGHWQIILAKPGLLGDQPVRLFHVTIRGNRTTVIRVVANTASGSPNGQGPGVSSSTPSAKKGAGSAPRRSTAATPASSGAAPRRLSFKTMRLRYLPQRGFRAPLLVYGSREYALTTPGEYKWAAALMSNLPGATPAIRSKMLGVDSSASKLTAPRVASVISSLIGLGGVGASIYGGVSGNSTVLISGLIGAAISLAVDIPALHRYHTLRRRSDAAFLSAVDAYRALPDTVTHLPDRVAHASSILAFSLRQGNDGWYYGYRTGDHGRFQLMTDVHTTSGGNEAWWTNYRLYWTHLTSIMVQGNVHGKSSGGNVNQEVVRRYVVPAAGRYGITAVFSRVRAPSKATVEVMFEKNDRVVWEKTLPRGDNRSHRETAVLMCRAGDTLDLVVANLNDGLAEWVNTSITIR